MNKQGADLVFDSTTLLVGQIITITKLSYNGAFVCHGSSSLVTATGVASVYKIVGDHIHIMSKDGTVLTNLRTLRNTHSFDGLAGRILSGNRGQGQTIKISHLAVSSST